MSPRNLENMNVFSGFSFSDRLSQQILNKFSVLKVLNMYNIKCFIPKMEKTIPGVFFLLPVRYTVGYHLEKLLLIQIEI